MKIRFIIITFIALILVGWGYAAYKFEHQSKENIISILDEYGEYITYDSIKVNKYGFSVTLNKVMLKPIDFYFDEIVIRHIPFLNITKIDSYGNDVKITTAQDEEDILYSPDHHTTIWFRKSLFNREPSYWKLSLSDNKSTLYSSLDAEKLAERGISNSVITNTKTSDNLNLLTIDGKDNVSFISEHYSKNLSDKILKFLRNKIEEDFNLNSFEYDLAKLEVLNVPTTYNAQLKLKYSDELLALGKLLIQNFSLNQKQDENMHAVIFMQMLGELVKGKPFLFSCDIERKGKVESNLYKLNIEKDKIFDFALNIKSTKEPSEIYQKTVVEALGSYFSNGLNKRAELDKIFKLTSPITQEDGEKVMGVFAKINNSEFNLKGEFDPEAKKLSGKTNLVMDDFNFAIDIDMPNLENILNLESVIKLSDPNAFINNFVNYTNNAIIPVLNKIEDSKEFALNLGKQSSIIKQYGFRAIEAFSKNSELKDGESLVVDVKSKDVGLTINDKTTDQIFGDARVLEFMNAMAQIDQERKQVVGK
ncbi:MAG: phosphoribosylaminoimidazolesuccinocarboxamide synthase [Rickettsia endosymbiont of Eriopis connexa]|nr:phosphoribosylaminoimidazolesuccinocarboxamide synthase [Rickettsia endosymbiont of Eriopis connexa]